MSLDFKTKFEPDYGRAVTLFDAPKVRRITAGNAGPYTFTGTNSFLVGRKSCCLIDPGPDDPSHLQRLVEEAEVEGIVTHILLTHTHLDHTAGVETLQRFTGAKTFGFGPHAVASAGGDMGFKPDVILKDGDQIYGDDWSLTAHHTPGHCQTHLCFGLDGTDLLFSGDHVMGWSSSVIIPPDGSLKAYFDSLEVMQTLPHNRYLPAHGGEIENGKAFAKALGTHRRLRNQQILAELAAHPAQPLNLEDLRLAIYPNLDASLHGAAQATLTAHMDYLVEFEQVEKTANSWFLKA